MIGYAGWRDYHPAAAPAAKRPHKYGAKAKVVDGIRFPSAREARRWQELKMLQHVGRIRSLERQVPIELHAAGGGRVGRYVADFRYYDVERGRLIVEDAKGFKTALYTWKKRHVAAEHNIEIQEV